MNYAIEGAPQVCCAMCAMCVAFDAHGKETSDPDYAHHGVCLKEGETLDRDGLTTAFEQGEGCWESEWVGGWAA